MREIFSGEGCFNWHTAILFSSKFGRFEPGGLVRGGRGFLPHRKPPDCFLGYRTISETEGVFESFRLALTGRDMEVAAQRGRDASTLHKDVVRACIGSLFPMNGMVDQSFVSTDPVISVAG